MRDDIGKEQWHIFAPHGSAVPSHGAGALPKQIFGFASGECVKVSQPLAGLREGEVGEEGEKNRTVDG